MRVFVYEFVTGGGAGESLPLGQNLFEEGRAMAAAITADFVNRSDCQVVTTRDSRLKPFHDSRCEVYPVQAVAEERAVIERLAALAERTVVIAPEAGGILTKRAQWVLDAGANLMSPGLAIIRLTSDKQATCDHLRKAGILAPAGRIVTPDELRDRRQPRGLKFPAVLKPIDGCGSTETYKVASWTEARAISPAGAMRIEEYVPGRPVSVGVLCGREGNHALPACTQQISDDGRFTYLGGRTPLSADLNRRAHKLALAAIGTLPQPRGYLGLDLVLGRAWDGRDDYVIEINPRLTTSYIGLRALCRENLASAMVAVANGQRPTLSWDRQSVQFLADGRIVGCPGAEAPPMSG